MLGRYTHSTNIAKENTIRSLETPFELKILSYPSELRCDLH